MPGSGVTPIAITGATGRLGGRVARRLAADDLPLRLVVRDPTRAPDLPGATVAAAAFGDASAVRDALRGVRTLLMVSASESADRVSQQRTFVDAAAGAGVEQVVYVSFYGAAPDCTFTLGRDHYATEQHLLASGMAVTILRDNLYADFLLSLAGPDGVIRGPAGDGQVAAVALDDVADCAAAVLRDAVRHAGTTYDLTGPESLRLDEIAGILSRATGREVRYERESIPQAYDSRANYGAPGWQVDAWVSTYTAIAVGELAGVSDAVPRLSGHPATSLAQLLAEGTSAY